MNPTTLANVYLEQKRKLYVLVTSNLTVFNSSLGSSLPANAIPSIAADFKPDLGSKDAQLVLPISLFLLGYVVGPLVFAPMSELWGRQRLSLVAFAAYSGFSLGCCLAPDWTSLLTFRLLAGISASVSLAVVPGIIADMYRDPVPRGRAVSSYMVTVIVAPLLAPTISGFLINISWRWVFWAALILAGATWIPLLFLPETYRPTLLSRHHKRMPSRPQNSAGPTNNADENDRKYHSTDSNHFEEPIHQHNRSWRGIVTVVMIRPLRLLTTEPIAAITCFYLAIVYAIFYMYFQVYPLIFQGVYGMSTGVSGLMFLPIAAGACFSLPVFNVLDRFFDWAQKTEKGWARREGARRLLPSCAGGPMMAISMFWLGWTANTSVPWVAPFLSGFLFGLGDLLIFTSLLNYLVDSYGIYSASAMAASSSTRSILGAILPLASYGIYDKLGIAWATTLLGSLTLIMSVTPFVFMRYSASIRKKSKFCQWLHHNDAAEASAELSLPEQKGP
jgi:MFS family permease